ncbi:N-acetylglucosamine kinase [Microbacterium sp. NPDC089698]|uniref:N-acetylglucosamine kinase n=1 Tax=Microbacterium sp. NPDC089698 TaxID=3364200 RepID=UPI00380AAC32
MNRPSLTESAVRRFVGVDIGGTKTHAMASADDASPGAEPEEILVPTSTWRAGLGHPVADAGALAQMLVERLGASVLSASVAVGAHGCDNSRQCEDLDRELRRYVLGPVIVVNDSELMAPAMERENAIGLVVGTGSIATARDDAGELVTAGGWGWALGDEGSAAGLVRDATKAVLTGLDEGDALDPLGRRLLARFEAHDAAELALAVGAADSAEARGLHAREVFLAADEGSSLAERVIDEAGDSLADLIDRLLRRGIRTETVVAGGSVIERQPRLQTALTRALARRRPEVDVEILTRPPVTGALELARRAVKQTPNPFPG